MEKYGQIKLPKPWITQTLRSSTQLARQFHYLYMKCLALLQEGTLTSLKPDLLEAAPRKDCLITQSELNTLRNVFGLFCTSCLHLANKEANNQIPKTIRWRSRGKRAWVGTFLQQRLSFTAVCVHGEWQGTWDWCLGLWERSFSSCFM